MLLFLTILFSITSVILGLLLFYSLRRINNYENLIIQFQQMVEYTKERLKVIDNSGHFEGDDEVGFFFDEIKELGNMLNGIFEGDDVQTEENTDGKE